MTPLVRERDEGFFPPNVRNSLTDVAPRRSNTSACSKDQQVFKGSRSTRAGQSGARLSRARTLLVGGNDVFLDSVVDWVAEDAQLEIVGRAHSGVQALERTEALRAELVLVDVSLPDMSGFEVARRMKVRPDAPLVVLLSFYDTEAARLEAWAAGADGFVPQSETTSRLKPLVGELFHRRDVTVREQGSVSSTKPVRPGEAST